MSFIEHRASERIYCDTPVVIENCQTGEHFDGSLYNHSRDGMYVEVDYFIEPDSVVRIVIERDNASNRPESRLGKIVWCKEIPGAVVLYNYGIGIRYDSTIPLSECKKSLRIIEGGTA